MKTDVKFTPLMAIGKTYFLIPDSQYQQHDGRDLLKWLRFWSDVRVHACAQRHTAV